MSQAFLILIPAHNEAQTIATVVSKCRNFSSDVLVIDDGSVDGTGSLASAAGAQVLRTAQCKGYGAALQLGFEECKKLQSKIVVTLDGDGTHDPEFVPSLINFHLDTQANLTIGSRFLTPRLAQAVPDAKAAANFFATTFGFTYKYLAAARRRGMRIVETGISVHYDAETLLSTNRTELTDFLASVVSIADGTNRRLRDALHEMCELVSAARVLRVCADGKHIIAHPIAHIDAYLFQFQDPCFLRQERQRNWIDWTSINARE